MTPSTPTPRPFFSRIRSKWTEQSTTQANGEAEARYAERVPLPASPTNREAAEWMRDTASRIEGEASSSNLAGADPEREKELFRLIADVRLMAFSLDPDLHDGINHASYLCHEWEQIQKRLARGE